MENWSRFLVVFILLSAGSLAQAALWNPLSWGSSAGGKSPRSTASASASRKAPQAKPFLLSPVAPSVFLDKLSNSTRSVVRKTQAAFSWEKSSRPDDLGSGNRDEHRSVRSQGGSSGRPRAGGWSILPRGLGSSKPRAEEPATLQSWLGQPRPE